jgi:preprotein translocase subunit Sec61beta
VSSARQAYVDAVVRNYVRLPGTPLRASRADRAYAGQLHDRGVPLRLVYAAFVLAAARRELRSADRPPLGAIRTLRFFHGAIEEAGELQLDPAYVHYLAAKIKPLVAAKEATLAAAATDRRIPALSDRR